MIFTKLIFFCNEFVFKDYFSVLQLINLNPVGAPLSWEYLREEWDYLVDRFTLNDRYCRRRKSCESFIKNYYLQ